MNDYLIIGNGRVASHLNHYLKLTNHSVDTWNRGLTSDPSAQIDQSKVVLLAISDRSIEEFYSNYLAGKKKTSVHFSGSLYFKDIYGAHPLTTFAKSLYGKETYEKIHFITEAGKPPLKEIFPKLHNRSFQIPPEKKSLYHALCVLSGAGTILLWENAFKEFETQLSLPREVLKPYLEQVAQNLKFDSKNALTGPFPRNDRTTIVKNLDALSGTPFQSLYYAFLNFYNEKTKTSSLSGEAKNERLNL